MAPERCCTTRHSGTHEEFNARRREYVKRWRLAHPGAEARGMKKWRDSDKGRVWTVAYRDRQRENVHAWRERDVEHARSAAVARQARRRARGAAPSVETDTYISILRSDPCAYCGGEGGVVDHIVPLAAGGENDWVNLTAACQPCNSTKHARPLLTVLNRKG